MPQFASKPGICIPLENPATRFDFSHYTFVLLNTSNQPSELVTCLRPSSRGSFTGPVRLGSSSPATASPAGWAPRQRRLPGPSWWCSVAPWSLWTTTKPSFFIQSSCRFHQLEMNTFPDDYELNLRQQKHTAENCGAICKISYRHLATCWRAKKLLANNGYHWF